MPGVNVGKKAVRTLGVAESFSKKLGSKSILAGVVMRSDLVIDGVVLGSCTVGGLDATESILEMWRRLGRDDVNLIMLNGCVISWFNVINLRRLHEETTKPLICITYEHSEGIEEYFRRYFPEDWEKRLAIHRENGERSEVKLHTGYTVYIRCLGINEKKTKTILNKFTLHGRIPEPLRVAKQISNAYLSLYSS